jgi:HlyD family secretion protein
MKKWIAVVIVLGLIATGWFALSRFRARQRAAAISDLQTVSVERGDLVAGVGATGTVRANQTAILTWQTSGSVSKVLVEAGTQVSADEVLAELEETSLPQNVIMAGAELANAQTALADLLKPASELSLRQTEQAIAKAERSVRDLERYVANLSSPGTQPDIDSARATVVLAENKLEQARQSFEPYANKPDNNLIRATLQSVLARAQKEYDAAVQRLNNLLGTANAVDLAAAKADLALAKAQLEDTQDQYERLLKGPEVDDIQAAEARVAAAQATVNQKHIAAPFTGTITEVQVKPGDQVAPGSVAFRLDDLSRLLVDVEVSEVDINQIDIGQDVILTFDAILGKEYHGIVSQVAFVGTPVQGVVDFIVTVELTDTDKDVKAGMTAAVNIAINQLQDVLLVPNRAVRIKEGQRVVYILRNGVPTPVDISLGASSETFSEVLEGDLQEGDQVVLNPPLEFEQNGPPPFVGR